MSLWNTPPEHLAAVTPLTRAVTAFMRATQELDAVSSADGPGCEAAVRRRLDAYAAARELTEAVRDAGRRGRRLEAAFRAADEALSEITLGDEPVAAARADKAMTAVVAALAFGAGTVAGEAEAGPDDGGAGEMPDAEFDRVMRAANEELLERIKEAQASGLMRTGEEALAEILERHHAGGSLEDVAAPGLLNSTQERHPSREVNLITDDERDFGDDPYPDRGAAENAL